MCSMSRPIARKIRHQQDEADMSAHRGHAATCQTKAAPSFLPRMTAKFKTSEHQNQKKLQKCKISSNSHGHKHTIYKAYLHTFLICNLKPPFKVLSPTPQMLKLRTEKIRLIQGRAPNLAEVESWFPNFLTQKPHSHCITN